MTRTGRPLLGAPSTVVGGGLVALVACASLVLVAHLVQASSGCPRHRLGVGIDRRLASALPGSGTVGFCAVLLYVPGLIALAHRPGGSTLAGRHRPGAVDHRPAALASLMGSGPVSLAMAQAREGRDDPRDRRLRVGPPDRRLDAADAGRLLPGPGGARHRSVAIGLPIVSPSCSRRVLWCRCLDAGRWWLALGYALSAAGMTLAAATIWRQDSELRIRSSHARRMVTNRWVSRAGRTDGDQRRVTAGRGALGFDRHIRL